MFWIELKAGIDPRLMINGIGTFELASGKHPRDDCVHYVVKDYNPNLARNDVQSLMKENLINDKLGNEILSLLKPQKEMTSEKYSELINIHKKVNAIRWSLDEVLEGVKTLPGNRQITLQQALLIPALTKLDTIFFNADRFVAMEAIYYIEYKGCEDVLEFEKQSEASLSHSLVVEHSVECKSKPGTLSAPMQNYYLNVAQNMDDYLVNGSYSKALKRFWVLLRQTVLGNSDISAEQGFKIMEIIAPVFSSKMAVFSRLSADCEALELLFQQFSSVTRIEDFKNKVYLHIDAMQKLVYQYGNREEKDAFYAWYMKMFKNMEGKGINPKSILHEIEQIHKYFKTISNIYAKIFIDENNLLPIVNAWCKAGRIVFK
jgi:hypothetical protein